MRPPSIHGIGVLALALGGLTSAPIRAVELADVSLSDNLAMTVGLEPLRNDGPDEVLILFLPRNVDQFAGYVISAGGITRCRSLTRAFGHATGACEVARNPERARRILAMLPALSQAKATQCTVLDGEALQVDGRVAGRQFDYQVYSPYNCNSLFRSFGDLTDGDNWKAP